MDPLLRSDEIECVRQLMGKIGCADSVVEAGPMKLIEDWRQLVARCQKGLRVERMDFLQALSVRTVLARLLARLPEPLRLKVAGAVREADFHFRALPRRDLTFLLDSRLKTRHPPERDFWLYGLPEGVRFT